MTLTEIIRHNIECDERTHTQTAAQEFRDRIDEKLKTVTELGEAKLAEARRAICEAQLARDAARPSREDLLELLQLLSALESWSFSLQAELPGYLHERLGAQIERVKAEILGGVAT